MATPFIIVPPLGVCALPIKTDCTRYAIAGFIANNNTIPKRGISMRYKIVYCLGQCANYANGKKDLAQWLRILKGETIDDIQKIYKDGTIKSIMKH